MATLDTCVREWGGARITVRIIDGLQHAGAVWMAGELVVGRGRTEAETEARIRQGLTRLVTRVDCKAS